MNELYGNAWKFEVLTMAEEKHVRQEQGIAVPSLSELRGRQSVRATFKLSGRAIEAISVAAAHMGIKQKSLFDHLIDDAKSLAVVAREVESKRFLRLKRVQKTFVLSRRTLCCLEEVSKDSNTPRDALVEYSIARLLPVIEEERKKHEKRKEILAEIGKYLEQGAVISEKVEEMLGEEDMFSEKLKAAISNLRGACDAMASFVEKGKVIEQF
jgi:ribosomal protein S16